MSSPKPIRGGGGSRLTFWCLVLSYPILSLLCVAGKWLEDGTVRVVLTDTYCVIAILLAFDASLKIRRRTKGIKKPWSQAADAALDLMPTLFLVAMAQVMNRDMASMLVDPEFIKKFDYKPSREVQHALQWMGAMWTILLAYTVKYHWDALIGAFENSQSD